MMRSKVFAKASVVACAMCACVPAAVPQGPTRASVERILIDSTLWGNDFPAVLANIRSWEQVGETAVVIFPDRVIGATPYEGVGLAQPRAEALADGMKEATPTTNPTFSRILETYHGVPPQFRVTVIPFPKDGSQRIAWTTPGLELLPPALTLKTVRDRLGPPEEVTRQVLQTEKDHRPTVLTGFSYAAGAAVFIESDLAPRPGYVERVVLNVAALAATLEEESK